VADYWNGFLPSRLPESDLQKNEHGLATVTVAISLWPSIKTAILLEKLK
jgi:hypothetical protein